MAYMPYMPCTPYTKSPRQPAKEATTNRFTIFSAEILLRCLLETFELWSELSNFDAYQNSVLLPQTSTGNEIHDTDLGTSKAPDKLRANWQSYKESFANLTLKHYATTSMMLSHRSFA
ncbi:predicted protein [Sclerotinia sclerotiorum 1980 UF-70]|uniref:Uncharacterized protein n=1 Tax=Sclerotinia sclerotiorum (strain ATCC 18683 / 1980 / Ss-1) TaxID=665079 RepID=A7ETR1_SCLS1|nr:predicted protein [Sclerotinia sclerotiorum 1980 UF-70]EDN92853.1 predicted protein [Sclerotinia sclerotiorum 1980 UF-70]